MPRRCRFRFLAVLLLSLSVAATASAARPQPDAGGVVSPAARFWRRGPYPVQVVTATWFDSSRSRRIPVKIYAPDAQARFPVIVFSHGLGGSRESCAYLGFHWASHGYVSVHVQHAGSDQAVWRGKLRPVRSLREAFERPENWTLRAQDILFALDQIEALAASSQGPGARLDPRRIGVAGHAFGASTALTVAGQAAGPSAQPEYLDPRIRAVVSMSAPIPMQFASLDGLYAAVRVPCLHMTGTEDDSPVGPTRAVHRRIPFDRIQGADQYLVTFYGGDHLIFSGHLTRTASRKDPYYQARIRAASVAFWDAYLKGDDQTRAWLTGGGLAELVGAAGRVEEKIEPATAASNRPGSQP